MAQFLTNERYGDGSGGVYSPSTGTDAPIDSACTGSSGATSLTATNSSFVAGQIIMIHQTIDGTNTSPGSWELNVIKSYVAGTITTKYPLSFNYLSGAQVLVLKQYANATIANGVTVTGKAWDGTVGGILAFIANGTTTINGTLTANGTGYRGGGQGGPGTTGFTGEGIAGGRIRTPTANYNGGGGGVKNTLDNSNSGAGGGHGSGASNGPIHNEFGTPDSGPAATGGGAQGSTDLITMVMGGGGGGGGHDSGPGSTIGDGGRGGGIVLIISPTFTMGASGAITSNGFDGAANADNHEGGGGGGAGGSILIKGITISLGSTLLTCTKGSGAWGCGHQHNNLGSDGTEGRIHVSYVASISGSTNPVANTSVDNTLNQSFFGGMV